MVFVIAGAAAVIVGAVTKSLLYAVVSGLAVLGIAALLRL